MDLLASHPAFQLVSFIGPDNPRGTLRTRHRANINVNNDLHVIHPVQGEADGQVGTERVKFTPDRVVFVPPHVEYRIWSVRGQPLQMLNFHFHMFLDGGRPLLQEWRLPYSFRPTNLSGIHRDLEQWKANWQDSRTFEHLRVVQHLHGLTLDYLHQFGERLPDVSNLLADPEMRLLHEQLSRNTLTNYCALELASSVFLSVSQMNRRFRLAFGQSPHTYWERVRFRRAMAALQQRSDSVHDIGQELGFEDQNYFSRWFKKLASVSPSQYRRAVQTAGQI